MTSPSAGPRHGPPRSQQRPPEQRPPDRQPPPEQHRQPDRQSPPEQHRQPDRQPAPEPRPRAAAAPAPEPAAAPPPRESTAVFALRITTYVLTSLASLVFLALVVYGYVALHDLGERLSSTPLFGGGQTPGSNYQLPTQEQLCTTNPDAPECRGTEGPTPTP